MAFVQLEDETGATEVIVFPKVWAEKEKLFEPGAALVVEGKVSRKDSRQSETEEVKILADTVVILSQDRTPGAPRFVRAVTVAVPDNGDRKLLEQIKGALERHPGGVPVTLKLPTVDGFQEMNLTHRVDAGDGLFGSLAYLLGSENVLFN